MLGFSWHGGSMENSLIDSAKSIDIVLLMLVNADHCFQGLFGEHGIVDHVKKNTVIILGSPTSASYAQELEVYRLWRRVLMMLRNL